jgi:hypothetical protein
VTDIGLVAFAVVLLLVVFWRMRLDYRRYYFIHGPGAEKIEDRARAEREAREAQKAMEQETAIDRMDRMIG